MNFTPTELERYSRQIQLPGFGEEGQKRLKDSTAVVTGVGGSRWHGCAILSRSRGW